MEMAELITTSNIVFALGILGVIFSVYNYFRSPQELLERKQLVAEEDLKVSVRGSTQRPAIEI